MLELAHRGEGAADDHLHEPRLARLGRDDRAHERTVPQHGHAVGDLAHLVEVVRDEQDRGAGRRRVTDEREQPLDALPRQEHGRLVEHEHAVATAAARCGSPRSRARSRAARARPASGRRRSRADRAAARTARRSRGPGRARGATRCRSATATTRCRRRGGSRARSATRRARGAGARSSGRARGTARSGAAAGPPRRRSTARPRRGRGSPARILISVDLPEPFSPRRPWTSPGSRLRSTPRSACVPPKLFVSPRASRRGCAAACATVTSGPRASGSRRRTSCPSRR